LRTWYHTEPDKWDEFEARYEKELDACPEAVDLLWKTIEEHQKVTFVYSAKNEERNNAVALKNYLIKHF
jgi:DNA-3-methyladenine glycosylase